MSWLLAKKAGILGALGAGSIVGFSTFKSDEFDKVKSTLAVVAEKIDQAISQLKREKRVTKIQESARSIEKAEAKVEVDDIVASVIKLPEPTIHITKMPDEEAFAVLRRHHDLARLELLAEKAAFEREIMIISEKYQKELQVSHAKLNQLQDVIVKQSLANGELAERISKLEAALARYNEDLVVESDIECGNFMRHKQAIGDFCTGHFSLAPLAPIPSIPRKKVGLFPGGDKTEIGLWGWLASQAGEALAFKMPDHSSESMMDELLRLNQTSGWTRVLYKPRIRWLRSKLESEFQARLLRCNLKSRRLLGQQLVLSE